MHKQINIPAFQQVLQHPSDHNIEFKSNIVYSTDGNFSTTFIVD